MQEPTLLKLSVVMALAGLGGLAYLASGPPVFSPIGNLTPDDVGRGVTLCGNVSEVFTSRNGHLFFTITDETGSLRGVVFNSSRVIVESGEECVIGRVDMYRNELEVIVEGLVEEI